MRILLATEDGDLRLSIELLLSQEPAVRVVGVASEADGLVALIASTRPDLVILDWDLPGRPLAKPMACTQTDGHSIHFLVLGKEAAMKASALHAGADAFVVKGNPPEELINAFRMTRQSIRTTAAKANETESS